MLGQKAADVKGGEPLAGGLTGASLNQLRMVGVALEAGKKASFVRAGGGGPAVFNGAPVVEPQAALRASTGFTGLRNLNLFH